MTQLGGAGNINLNYGGMYIYENATESTIDTTDVYHLLRGFTTDIINNWTFGAGSTGAISAYADGGSGEVTVTSAGHSLAAGDIISITGSTNYNAIYTIESINGNNFNITAAWVGDDATGTFNQGSFLKAGTSATGIYKVGWSMSASLAVANKKFRFELVKNTTNLDNFAAERKFGSTDVGVLAGTGIISITDGDIITFAGKNTEDTTNFTIKHANIALARISG